MDGTPSLAASKNKMLMRAATVLCNSCPSLVGLVLCFIACFILLVNFVIAPFHNSRRRRCTSFGICCVTACRCGKLFFWLTSQISIRAARLAILRSDVNEQECSCAAVAKKTLAGQ